MPKLDEATAENLGTRSPALEDTHRATLNILDDFAVEKAQLQNMQRAVLNILEDLEGEKAHFMGTQRAVLNILDDFDVEKGRLENTQRAALNILEDFDLEKTKAELAYRELRKQIGERERAEEEVRKLNQDLELRAAELATANKELESFSYSVAHDLRAPLRAITGFSTMLLQDHANALDAEGRRVLGRITQGVQRMGQLIEDLLNFARIGRAEMNRSIIDMKAVAESVTETLRQDNPGRAVRVTVSPLPAARGDPALLRQVWVNLVANAFKFTRHRPEGVIEIGSYAREGENVYFVRDNGEGFDPQYAEKLFGVFQRLHSESEFEGTGIGLAIVQRVIQRHRGRVWAEGKPSAGAMFYFSMPAEPEAQP
jgi:light-regulated signal transduction histidine kinase (bacteriophytochrome)